MLAVTITTLALMHRSALPQAMVTDFDAWHPDHDSVTGERMLALFRAKLLYKTTIRTPFSFFNTNPVRVYNVSNPVEQVVATAMKNVATAKEVVKAFVQIAGEHSGEAPCSNAMAGACMTAPDRIPIKRRDELEVLVGKYM